MVIYWCITNTIVNHQLFTTKKICAAFLGII